MNQMTSEKYLTFFLLMAFWKFQYFNLASKISQKLFKPLPCHKFQYLTVLEKCCMPSVYLQWQFHSGEWVVASGPLVLFEFDILVITVKVMSSRSVNLLTLLSPGQAYRINPPIRRGFFPQKSPKNPDPSYNQGLWPYRYSRQSPVVPRDHGKCRSSKPVEGYYVYLRPLTEIAAR